MAEVEAMDWNEIMKIENPHKALKAIAHKIDVDTLSITEMEGRIYEYAKIHDIDIDEMAFYPNGGRVLDPDDILTIQYEELLENGVCPKYILTQRGIQEIHENKYVPYMHIYSTTIEGVDNEFNVWTVNKELGNKDKLFWDKYILEKFINSSSDNDDSYLNPKNYAKKYSISDAKIIKLQDKQFKKINKAEEKYFRNNNLNEHIAFWENLWNTEGLFVQGVSWYFKLADLYIEAKEYDKALDFVKKINKLEPSYLNNTEYYLETISKLIAKQKKPNL